MQRPPIFSTETSLTDMTEEANVQRAAADLNRALDRNDDAGLLDWARRYGPHAIAALSDGRVCPECNGFLDEAA